MSLEIVQFHDDQIEAIRGADGREFVTVRRVCENLDIDYASQFTKLKKAHWAGVVEITMPDARGREQKHSVIPIDSLPMWLVTIKPGKIAEHLRDKLKRYQIEARDVLARHFKGPQVAPTFRYWSERLKATSIPHLQYVNIHHPGCFTVVTTFAISILGLEDELVRHMFQLCPSDRPDGSIGQCWANERRRRGMVPVTKTAPLYLPDSGYEVNLCVYNNEERGACEHWFHTTYLPSKLPSYLVKKPEFKVYGELAVASVAENACRTLSGLPARIKPRLRKQIVAAGGFCPAGYSPPQLPSPQRMLFDVA